MSCNCGYPNPDGAVYCSICGEKIEVRTQDRYAASMFSIPEYVMYIYTVGQRRRLLKGLRFLTFFMLGLTWLSFNLLAFILSPLYAMWVYFYYNFSKTWRVYSYSRLVLNSYMAAIIAAGFASGIIVRVAVGALVRMVFL